jgi:hypothetical protein
VSRRRWKGVVTGKTCGGKSISAEALLIQLSHLDLVWKSIDWEMDGRVLCKRDSHVFQDFKD